jgi:D-alanyl-D-alanine dipeptidase
MTSASQALSAFQEALDTTREPHGELTALEKAGWQEECPSEDWWHFQHRDYPGILINWSPGHQPWASGQGRS